VEVKDFVNKRLMGRTIGVLSHALDYRSANHSVISGNLANIDTPGYKPKELNFDQELRRAVEGGGISLKKTDARHFPHSTAGLYSGKGSHTLETREQDISESNQMNLDREMARMVQNNLLYEASAKLLSKKLEGLRLAIEGRR
jgi:flagellar basal-body rod protein FlgB